MPEPHTQPAAYAADALDGEDERREFEEHMAGCAECREEVRTLRETTAALAEAVAVAPPEGLRARVLAEIGATPQLPVEVPVGVPVEAQGRRPVARRWLAVAASVVLLAGVGLGAVGAVQLYRAHQAEQRADEILAIVGDPNSQQVSGPVQGGGSATLVVSGPRGVLVTSDVSALPQDRIYQLWVIRSGQVSSAGLGPGGPAAAGSWTRLVEGLASGDQVAMSVEPDGGSAQPTTQPVAVLAA